MRNLYYKFGLIALLVAMAILAITPVEKQLRRGKDLAGGASLIYSVQFPDGVRPSEGMAQAQVVVAERLNPTGQLEISVVPLGTDRLEITMPLPSDRVKGLRAEYEEALNQFLSIRVDSESLDAALALTGDERDTALAELFAGDETRLRQAQEAAGFADEEARYSALVPSLQQAIDDIQFQIESLQGPGSEEMIRDLTDGPLALAQGDYDEAIVRAGTARNRLEDLKGALLSQPITRAKIDLAVRQDNRKIVLRDENEDLQSIESPREVALAGLRGRLTDESALAQFEGVLAKWEAYEAERSTLDDPSDIIRLLQGAGVLEFRITVNTGERTDEQDLREDLREGGPNRIDVSDVMWCKINKPVGFANNKVDRFRSLRANPSGYFGAQGYVVEEYLGDYYMLCWDRSGLRLTADSGIEWGIAGAGQGQDQIGRPAISFTMDASGARLLGSLTSANVGRKMAILLDDQVYTAPNINSAISRSGIIEGEFTPDELNYVIRVMTAGSLKGSLSPAPISQTTFGPELGEENLAAGLNAGLIAIVLVSVFMVVYYFFYGGVAVTALAMNALLLVGLMALGRAAFTLPGIAGIVLTFGIAVDANVLIYERVREELIAGADLRTSVRLGYQRALSAIVDGNVTNLIVCVVLGYLGTPEIKGFAITLGIGVATTLFTSLFVTRALFSLFIEGFGWRKMRMLPTAVPALHRFLEPSIDWMRIRFGFLFVSAILVGLGVTMIVKQGGQMLDVEFVGGTQMTVQFRDAGDADAEASGAFKTTEDVENGLNAIAERMADSLPDLAPYSVVPMDPDAEGRSNRFRIKTRETNDAVLQEQLVQEFGEDLAAEPPIDFIGRDDFQGEARSAPVFPITEPSLSAVLGRADVSAEAPRFVGGVAILLDDLNPAPSIEVLKSKLMDMRSKPDFNATLARTTDIVVIEGTETNVGAAILLVRDSGADFFDTDEATWWNKVGGTEWELTVNALKDVTTLASVQKFEPAVAATFRASAIAAILISAVLIVIYVWVRFGSLRYSLAAILTTLHDVLIMVGLIAAAELVYYKFPGFANAVGILPFKIDLNLVAAILTILGYSLNDTIVIMDRIRENRGKLPYASRAVVNLAINQTLSRTVITSGTTLIATGVLYVYGGEGVREFAYALLMGIAVGTFSSVAIASPMVWSRKADRSLAAEAAAAAEAEAEADGASGG